MDGTQRSGEYGIGWGVQIGDARNDIGDNSKRAGGVAFDLVSRLHSSKISQRLYMKYILRYFKVSLQVWN